MKVREVIKLDKRNKTTSKNLTMTSYCEIVTSLQLFQFTVNLEQSESRIPDVQSVKRMFSLTTTFYLTKTENRTNKSLTQLSYYCFK